MRGDFRLNGNDIGVGHGYLRIGFLGRSHYVKTSAKPKGR
jgi:hypothetical protein